MAADGPLEGRSAIVTGASSGIGEATARRLTDDGAAVALAARREERLRELAEEIEADGGEALVVPTDVTEVDQVEALVEATVEEFDGLDVLVNNAGLGRGDDVETMSDEQYRAMMSVNADGVFYATRAALPHLKDSAGNLVFVGSFAGQYPRKFNPVYAATKWWVRGFALSVEASVGDDGVAVTTVNLSEVRTEFGSEDGDPMEAQFERGEVTEPDEVAEAIAFALRGPSTVSELDLYRRDKLADTID